MEREYFVRESERVDEMVYILKSHIKDWLSR